MRAIGGDALMRYTTSTSEPSAMVLAAASSSSSASHYHHRPPLASAYACTGRVCPLTLQARWDDWRFSARLLLSRKGKKPAHVGRRGCVPVRCEIAGQYEESFADVDKHLLDYFTFKAVRTVLVQLYEMNPAQYTWFYRFVVENKPQDSKVFLSSLVKERQELGERVMVTRLHLFNLWIKKYDHAKMYQAISDQNLELLRERLVQTVKWPSADTDDKQQA
eukprot:c43896_g1_i1 orf=567-1226(-)